MFIYAKVFRNILENNTEKRVEMSDFYNVLQINILFQKINF